MFKKLYNLMLDYAGRKQAPYYLAMVSFAESSFFPLPPDIMLIPMSIARPMLAILFALLTTITSVLGGVAGYLIGYYCYTLIAPWIAYFHYEAQYQQVVSWFDSYGALAVFVAGFTPIPYKLFTIGAGSVKLSLGFFVFASMLGRGARFFLVSTLAKRYGDKLSNSLLTRVNNLGWMMVGVIVLALVGYKYF